MFEAEFRVEELSVWGSGLRVYVLWFRVQRLGFTVQGSGFRF
jgi:N6-adenosine-specific RNA methylase IME4